MVEGKAIQSMDILVLRQNMVAEVYKRDTFNEYIYTDEQQNAMLVLIEMFEVGSISPRS